MVGGGVITLEFSEQDLAAQVPKCCEVVAAALMCGFPLVVKPAANHEDVLLGCERLQQFKDAKARQLNRLVRFHFYEVKRHILGDALTPQSFRQRWDSDATFRRTLKEDARFNGWYVGLSQKLSAARRSVLAVEGTRQTYGAIHGNPETLAAMAGFHENGGI